MNNLLNENKQWIDETWAKVEEKLNRVVKTAKYKLPSRTVDGKYNDCSTGQSIQAWTNGFWPGMMWLMYAATGNEDYKESAEYGEDALDKALEWYDCLHHDVGFMWLLSAVANYRITGNEKSRNRALHAATVLGARYNANGQYIGAWQGEESCNWVIIDCMMNIPLLYWATEQTKNPSFKSIAMHHADTCLRDHVRPDGSVNHAIEYDGKTGEMLGKPFTQGYDMDSAWSRGQSWAIYGFAQSYAHTGEQRYLDAAKKVSHYFIASVCNDGYLPKADFMQPDDPYRIDSSAGAIAACGMLEIAKHVPEREQKLYVQGALNLLKALTEKECDWSEDEDAILLNNSGSWGQNVHQTYIVGDYYYVEAMYRLKGFERVFW